MATSCHLDRLAMLSLPEYVYAKLATEVNPISVDMTSPGYALIVARSPARHTEFPLHWRDEKAVPAQAEGGA